MEELTVWKRELYGTVRRSYDTLIRAGINVPNYVFSDEEQREYHTVRVFVLSVRPTLLLIDIIL